MEILQQKSFARTKIQTHHLLSCQGLPFLKGRISPFDQFAPFVGQYSGGLGAVTKTTYAATTNIAQSLYIL